MASPASTKAIGKEPPDQGDRQRRWLELSTLQWEADGNHLLRPMGWQDGHPPEER